MVDTETIESKRRQRLETVIENLEPMVNDATILSRLELYELLSQAYTAGQADFFDWSQRLLGVKR